MIYLSILVHVFLFIIFLVSLFNVITAPMLSHCPESKDYPRVSVLVPVRNEQDTIGKCLQGLLEQDYPDYEIIVLDDNSTDRSREIIVDMQKTSSIRLVDGEPITPGWTGKNYACHQLLKAATGEIFIFTDADNFHRPNALKATVAWMQKYDLGLLSAFPQQVTTSLAEKLVIPVVDMWVYSMLPLWLTRFSKRPSLAAANGQWLAFTREAYEITGGHAAVKKEIVEDTHLARIAKQKGVHILTLAGRDVVYGKMYNNWSQVYNGYSKNLFGIAGYNAIGFSLFLFLMLMSFVLPFVLVWGWPFLWLYPILINFGIRTMIALKYKHPVMESVIFHPVGIFLFIVIGIRSMVRYYKGGVEWKGRNIVFEK